MKLYLVLLILMFSGCSNQNLKNYKDENPKLNLRTFFNGKIIAQGIVQDRSGTVIKRFDVDMMANWNGNECVLDEKFHYSDNTKSTRVWKLVETSPLKYQGTAADVVGVANGEIKGNTFYYQYNLKVPMKDDYINIHFEDWMYLLDNNTLMARSYMTKWGIDVGEVTIVMKKVGN
jgi:hypothetical protein